MVSREEFEQLVADALATLPPQIIDRMDNVAITVQEWPSRAQLDSSRVPPGSTLFGLYQGVPLTRRSSHYGMVPPDRITIFRGPDRRARDCSSLRHGGSADRVVGVLTG